MSKAIAISLLTVIVLFGIGVRAWQLPARSLWFDEAFSWRLIQFSIPEMLDRAAADVHPPLYYLVLKGWKTVFEDSLVSLRLFSVIFAGATIAAAYRFAAEAFYSRSAGIVAALLIAVSGFQIQFAWEARMYTLGTFLLLISSWLLIRAIRRPTLTAWSLYGICAALFAYVHYYAFFSLAGHALFVFGYLLVSTHGRIGEILQSKKFWFAALAGLLATLIYAPQIPIFLQQNNQVQESYWIPTIGGWSIPDTFYRMYAPTPGIPQHQGVGWIALAIIPIAATGIMWIALAFLRKHRDGIWLTISLGLTPFLISIGISILSQSLYQDRFFVFAHIFILIGLAALTTATKPMWLRVCLIILLSTGLAAGSVKYWNELNIANKPGAQAATTYIYHQRNDNQPIIVSSPFIYFSILHYGTKEFSDASPKLYSETGELAHFAGGPILIERDIIKPSIFEKETATIWLVDTTGFGGTMLDVPNNWSTVSQQAFPEVYAHQGEIIVRELERDPLSE